MSRTGVFVAIFWAAAPAGCADSEPISQDAAVASECMLRELRKMPAVEHVEQKIAHHYQASSPVIVYVYRLPSGQLLHGSMELTDITSLGAFDYRGTTMPDEITLQWELCRRFSTTPKCCDPR